MAITISVILFFGAFFAVANNSYRMISGKAVSVYSVDGGMALQYDDTAYLLQYDPSVIQEIEQTVGQTPSLLPLPMQMPILLTELAQTVVSFLPPWSQIKQ